MAGGRQQNETEELKRRIRELEQELERITAHHASNTDSLEDRIFKMRQDKKNESHQSIGDRLGIWEEIEELRNYLEEIERITPTVYYSFHNEGNARTWTSTVVNAFHVMLGEDVNVIPFDSTTPKNAPVFVCHIVASRGLHPQMEFYDNLSTIKADRQGIVFVMGLRAVGRGANQAKLEYGPKDQMPLRLIGTEYIEFQFDAVMDFPKELLTSNAEREMQRVRECVGTSARSSQPMPSALTTGNFRFLQKYLQPAAVHSDVSRQPTDDEDLKDINRKLMEQLQASEEAIQEFRLTIDEQEETIEMLQREHRLFAEEASRLEQERNKYRSENFSYRNEIDDLKEKLRNSNDGKDLQSAAARPDVSRQSEIERKLQVENESLKQQIAILQTSSDKTTDHEENIEHLQRKIQELTSDIEDLNEMSDEANRKFLAAQRTILELQSRIGELELQASEARFADIHYAPVQQSHTRPADECEDLKRDVTSMQQYFAGSQKGTVPAALTSGRFKFVWDYLQQTALPTPRQENPALQQEISSMKQFFDNAREGIVTVYYVLAQKDDGWVETIENTFKMVLGKHVIVSRFDPNSTPPNAHVFVCEAYERIARPNIRDLREYGFLNKTVQDIRKKHPSSKIVLVGFVATSNASTTKLYVDKPMSSPNRDIEYIEFQFEYNDGKGYPLTLITRGAPPGPERLHQIIGPVTKRPDVPPALTEGTFKFVWDYMQTIMPPTS